MMPEQGAVYLYKVWWGDKYRHSDTAYSYYETAMSSAKDEWEREEAPEIVVEKLSVDSASGKIEAVYNYTGNLMTIRVSGDESTISKCFPSVSIDDAWWMLSIEDMFFIDVPTPFKRGDILTVPGITRQQHRWQYTDAPLVFVLDGRPRDNSVWLARALRGEICDGNDMIDWGLYVDKRGMLYRDHTLPYDCFEYYTGKLEGDNRLLHYVNLFIQEKISLASMLNMQCRIVAEHDLKHRFIINDHVSYLPEELLAENRPQSRGEKE
jgi:hypothetical protein